MIDYGNKMYFCVWGRRDLNYFLSLLTILILHITSMQVAPTGCQEELNGVQNENPDRYTTNE
jgi:hypothetical protein